MNDYKQHYGTHLCLPQWSFAYCYVLLFLSNKRKFEDLFFLEITLELFLWSSFTLDSGPWAFEKFPLLMLRNAFWLLPLSALTLVQSFIQCHGKCNITFKILICRLRMAVVASHSLNHDVYKPLTWPVTVFNAAFDHALHEDLTDPPLLCLGKRFNAVIASVDILQVRLGLSCSSDICWGTKYSKCIYWVFLLFWDNLGLWLGIRNRNFW